MRKEEKGMLWKLPSVNSKELGRLGPAFGIGAGCGVGFGFGLIGGAGLGPGFPGVHIGFGVGAVCGVGVGFGYALGKGIAYDDSGKHTNIRKLTTRFSDISLENDIGALFDGLVHNSKKLVKATSKEIEKWRR